LSDTGEKWEYNMTVHQLFIDFKKVYDSVRRVVLCDILMEAGVPMNLIRLIKMCLNETCSKVLIDNHLSDSFPIQNGLQQRDALSALLFNSFLKCVIRKVQENQVELKLSGNHQCVTFADDVSKDIKIRIHKIIILLPVVLYGCETWSLILRAWAEGI
jgi:hypothetical protein